MKEENYTNILSSLPDKKRNIISNAVSAILVIMLLLIVYAGFRSLAARYTGVSESSYLMGTTFDIKVNGKNAGRLVKAALSKVKEIADLTNYYDDRSEISAINNMAGISAVAVNHDTFDLIDKAIKLGRQTGGAFDITIGPLVDIWSFNSGSHTDIPAGNALIYAQHLVNYNNVQANSQNETVKLLYPGMKINLDFAAKGYAISKARAILVEGGVKSAVINAGSSMMVIGDDRGKPWKVGIKDPRRPDEMVGVVTLTGGQSISTCGDYEDYFEIGGKRYHNILDPRTGMPAEECRSVSIISNDATEADMLSTAVFVMGPQRGLAYVNMFKDVYAVIIDKDGKVTTSPGLKLER